MGRLPKEGLSYFPEDVSSLRDIKVRRLLKAFGAKGWLIYDYIRKQAYEDKGYYVECNEDYVFLVSDDLSIASITEQLVNEVITFCGNVGLFDQELLTREKIITSRGIQKRYIKVCRDANRMQYGVLSKFLLLDEIDEKEIISEENPIPSEKIPISSEEIPINSEKSAQRKEKKRKGKERKEKERKEAADSVLSLWDNTFSRTPNTAEYDGTKALIDRFGYETIYSSMRKGAEARFRNFFNFKNKLNDKGELILEDNSNEKNIEDHKYVRSSEREYEDF